MTGVGRVSAVFRLRACSGYSNTPSSAELGKHRSTEIPSRTSGYGRASPVCGRWRNSAVAARSTTAPRSPWRLSAAPPWPRPTQARGRTSRPAAQPAPSPPPRRIGKRRWHVNEAVSSGQPLLVENGENQVPDRRAQYRPLAPADLFVAPDAGSNHVPVVPIYPSYEPGHPGVMVLPMQLHRVHHSIRA